MIRNDIFRSTLGGERLQDKIGRERLKWYSYMKRMDEYRLLRAAHEEELRG